MTSTDKDVADIEIVMPKSKAPTTVDATVQILMHGATLLTVGLYIVSRSQQWTLGYVYLGLLGTSILVNAVCMYAWNPTLIRQRMGIRKGTVGWDWFWLIFVGVVFYYMAYVMTKECRARSYKDIPDTSWLLYAVLIHLPGSFIITASMSVNPFFEKSVRIQRERGHQVIDTGAYAYVRHPGYVGFALWLMAAPLLLQSQSQTVWICTGLLLVAVLIRTYFEDQTLQRELHGYRSYTRRVQYRLIPFVW